MPNFLTNTTHNVAWFMKRYHANELQLKAPFQRNPVWTDKQKSYLIDTMLRGFPIPELYMQEAKGIQNKSTQTLFNRAAQSGYGPQLPNAIRESLERAYQSWFPELRLLRSELAHRRVGHCAFDSATQKVGYAHGGLGDSDRAFQIEDFVGHINRLAEGVRQLLDEVFGYLFGGLLPIEKVEICGVMEGQMYMRRVAPAPDLSFHSGVCQSHSWPNFACPFAPNCGAYSRAVVAS